MASARFASHSYGAPSSDGFEQFCRGQQGCPMMGPFFCLTKDYMCKKAWVCCTRPPPEFECSLTNNSFSGGPITNVFVAFQRKCQVTAQYGSISAPKNVRYIFVAGNDFGGDVLGPSRPDNIIKLLYCQRLFTTQKVQEFQNIDKPQWAYLSLRS